MLNRYTFGGCECWLTEKTAKAILAEQAEYEEFMYLVRLHEKCLAENDPSDWDYYSDLYKATYGVRPHF